MVAAQRPGGRVRGGRGVLSLRFDAAAALTVAFACGAMTRFESQSRHCQAGFQVLRGCSDPGALLDPDFDAGACRLSRRQAEGSGSDRGCSSTQTLSLRHCRSHGGLMTST
eukprot:3904720-Rhodomonas_salina.3